MKHVNHVHPTAAIALQFVETHYQQCWESYLPTPAEASWGARWGLTYDNPAFARMIGPWAQRVVEVTKRADIPHSPQAQQAMQMA